MYNLYVSSIAKGLGGDRERGAGRVAQVRVEKGRWILGDEIVHVDRLGSRNVRERDGETEDSAEPRDRTTRCLEGVGHRGDREQRFSCRIGVAEEETEAE